MSNHEHLLITPHIKGAIGKVMQTRGRYYVQYFNHRYGRTGALWEGRYKEAWKFVACQFFGFMAQVLFFILGFIIAVGGFAS